MDALVMCGGRGSRLDTPDEKPLYEVGGRPMIDHVCEALTESSLDTVHAATSPDTPETHEYLAERSVPVVETPGAGYVADLDAALDEVSQPVLTVAADLPLLTPAVIDRLSDTYGGGSLTAAVPAALKEALGVSYDRTLERDEGTLVPAGINVVADSSEETLHVTYDARVAVNVNRLGDAAVAERLLDDHSGRCS